MQTKIGTFSNKRIESLLEGKEDNYRVLSPRHSERWRREMEAGRWVSPHPQPIVLNKDGSRLLDGQHRLLAAFHFQRQSKERIKFLICYVDDFDAIQLTMDTGKPRSIADHLRRVGALNVTTVASVIKLEAKVSAIGELNAQMFDGSAGVSPSVSEMADIYDASRSSIDKLVRDARAVSKIAAIGSPGLIASCGWQIRKCGMGKFQHFIEKLATGDGLSASDPIGVLRRTLQQRAVKSRANRRTIENRSVWAALIIKAWNAYVDDRVIVQLRWAQDELFPLPAKVAK